MNAIMRLILISILMMVAAPAWSASSWASHELISRYRVSLSPAPTFAYELLATRVPDSRLRGLDLSSWRYAWVGAEPIFSKTLFGFQSRFRRYGLPEHALAPCYGLAEATLAVSATEPGREVSVAWVKRKPLQAEGVVEPGREDDDENISIVGVGRPLSWAETRLVDDADVHRIRHGDG